MRQEERGMPETSNSSGGTRMLARTYSRRPRLVHSARSKVRAPCFLQSARAFAVALRARATSLSLLNQRRVRTILSDSALEIGRKPADSRRRRRPIRCLIEIKGESACILPCIRPTITMIQSAM
jgi:hypothetical protein